MLAGLGKFASVVAGAAALAGLGAHAEDRPRPECFSTAQTREQIARRKLAEPFSSMQAASREMQGDPISARLCRLDENFIYEIALLLRDGRIVRILVDAVSGKPQSYAKQR